MPKMHGPSFQTGETVNTDVHPDNVPAFIAAGWKKGALDGAPDASSVDAPDEKPSKKAKDEK